MNMDNYDENEIKSVQIIKIEGTKFTFDFNAFQNIVEKNAKCKDMPVGVIIINGPLRTGKSFFSNFIIRYLKSNSTSNTLSNTSSNTLSNTTSNTLSNTISDNVLNKDDEINRDILNNNILNNDEDVLTDYFISRRGPNIQTLGVWALDEIFVYNGMAIVLMDTQGIFDSELNQSMTIALISLSTIVSSYQIYNLDKRIQEDHLCNMAYFSAYSQLLTNTNNMKLGQTLCLLVRDWQNFDNNFDLERCDIETENYKYECLDNTQIYDNVKFETRKKLYDTYENVVVKLCPHPGYIVTEGKFSGRLSDIRDDFITHVEHIITGILRDVKPKKIGSSQVLLCRELPVYLKEYVRLYENVKESLPKALNILETTEKICQENARTKTVHHYKELMLLRIKNRSMSKEDIQVWHYSCVRESEKFFKRLYILGKDEDITNIKNLINADIANEFKNFLLMARDSNILALLENTFKTIFEYLHKIDMGKLINYVFNNILLFVIVTYIVISFIPLGEVIFTIMKLLCFVFFGVYIGKNINQNNASNQLPKPMESSDKFSKVGEN